MDAGIRGIEVFWDNGPVPIAALDEQLQVQAWGWAWREAWQRGAGVLASVQDTPGADRRP